jgi:hypothetical protein
LETFCSPDTSRVIDALPVQCDEAEVEVTQLSNTSATAAFEDLGGTRPYSLDLTTSYDWTLEVPFTCTFDTDTCDLVEDGLVANGVSASCVSDVDHCDCAGSRTFTRGDTGTWQTSGNSVILISPVLGIQTYDYCARDGFVVLQDGDSDLHVVLTQ